MELTLKSPLSTKKMAVDWFEVQTERGSFVIKEGHAPMLLVLTPEREVTIGLTNGSETVLSISKGIVVVNRQEALLIVAHD